MSYDTDPVREAERDARECEESTRRHDGEPILLTVSGRGRLVAEATASAAGCTIRVDDDARPEFWAEIRLSAADLRQFLARVEAAQDEVDPADRDEVAP